MWLELPELVVAGYNYPVHHTGEQQVDCHDAGSYNTWQEDALKL
jgi:hypothetical protein